MALVGAQGYPHEPNPSTPMQAGTSPLECWYSGMVNQTAYSTVAGVLDFIRAYPVVIGRSGIIDRLAFEVTTGGAAGAVARCAIYRPTSEKNHYPSSLVVDGGEFGCTSIGVKAASVSIFLGAGLYWLCQLQGVAVSTSRRTLAAGTSSVFGVPITLGAFPNDTINTAFSYAAFPATFPGGGLYLAGSAVRGVHVRFSA